MSRYIRSYTQGATYFFTLVSYQRRKIFTNPDFLKALRASIKETQKNYPFKIIACGCNYQTTYIVFGK